MTNWTLECSACDPVHTREAAGLPGVCEVCGSPYLVRYETLPPPEAKTQLRGRRWTMWRYDGWLPLGDGEQPVTLGEGGTPLLKVERIAARQGFEQLWVKDEATNPTGSFKARGLAAAVTRAAFAVADGSSAIGPYAIDGQGDTSARGFAVYAVRDARLAYLRTIAP